MAAQPIRHVSDTAHWVAAYRAQESERSDALFRDPHARRLAGERGVEICRSLPFGQSIAWALAVRTAVFDEMIVEAVGRGARAVLNLGAGLDARAYRLPLPKGVLWIDVDLPAVIAYRRRCLGSAAAVCRHLEIAADLCDDAGFAAVAKGLATAPQPVLVVTEGVLVYLEAAEVRGLASRLHAELAPRWWLTDLIGPLALHSVGPFWRPHLQDARAELRFAPAEGARFFQPLGWNEIGYRSIWSESLRLRRSIPMAEWWAGVESILPLAVRDTVRRASGVTLLERSPPGDGSPGRARRRAGRLNAA